MEYKIEKGIVMPEPRGLARKVLYPFDKMDIGDSFEATIDQTKKIQPRASYWGKENGKKFSIRQVSQNTIRCWRIA